MLKWVNKIETKNNLLNTYQNFVVTFLLLVEYEQICNINYFMVTQFLLVHNKTTFMKTSWNPVFCCAIYLK